MALSRLKIARSLTISRTAPALPLRHAPITSTSRSCTGECDLCVRASSALRPELPGTACAKIARISGVSVVNPTNALSER